MSVFDIHSHIIPFIDDGSDSLNDSVLLLNEAIKHGVTDIIATPHYCPNRGFSADAVEIKERFNLLISEIKSKNLPINVYLGQEIYCYEYDNIIKKLDDGELLTLNNTKYVLLEYSMSSMPKNIFENIYNLTVHGYKPIIAHIERYKWMTVNIASELKDEGCLLQVNASSFGNLGKMLFCKKLLKNGLIDIVASDAHFCRKNCFDKIAEYNKNNTLKFI